MQNYTTFQRRLRDAIVKKVGTFGFDVKLLEDNDQYEKFKTKDGSLVLRKSNISFQGIKKECYNESYLSSPVESGRECSVGVIHSV